MKQDGTFAFDRLQYIAGIVGAIGAVILLGGAIVSTHQFFQSYLFAYIFWIQFALGCFALFMLHHLVSGGWGFVTQRVMEAGMRTLPLMAVLFIPILFGMNELYPWARGADPSRVRELHTWSAYLNPGFFIVRTIIYFCFWIGTAWILTRWSGEQDRTADPRLTRKIRLMSAPGLVLYVLTMTFASVDWVMSLEPGWFSTIYGFLIVVSQVLASLGLIIIAARLLAERAPISEIITQQHSHHLGNLLLTFVILWAYMAYSQYIIIWSGNLPDENSWYLRRLAPGWAALGLFVVVVHFFVPLILLLFRRAKRSIRPLSLIAAGIIVMRLVDTFWLVVPSFSPAHFRLQWLDVVAPIALGGLWTFFFVRNLKGRSLVPLHDPRFSVIVEPVRG